MLDFAGYVKIFVSLLVIVNPIGTMPMFLGLTHKHSVADKKRIARVASISMAIVLTVSAVVGEHLLGFFGITIASFRVGGAILILLLAISMMHAAPSGERSEEHTSELQSPCNLVCRLLLEKKKTLTSASRPRG